MSITDKIWKECLGVNSKEATLAKEAATEVERLKKMVVMRFDHDEVPEFSQGYQEHEVLEPVTAKHCEWFVKEIQRLRAALSEAQAKQDLTSF